MVGPGRPRVAEVEKQAASRKVETIDYSHECLGGEESECGGYKSQVR